MNTQINRIAIMVGAGFVPGMNAAIKGAALAAGRLGWEVVGIRDGFEGLLHPECYSEGGLLPLTPHSLRTSIPPPAACWVNRAAWIRSMFASLMPTRWWRKWISPMSCWPG